MRVSVPDLVEYTAKIGAVLDTVRRLLDAGSSADLAPLARRAVDDIVRMAREYPELAGRIDEAIALYARACAARPPEPVELAEWLLSAAFAGRAIRLADFAAALGDRGTARIKSTVDEVLAGAPEGERREIAERLLEEVAEVSGDVDGLVAILAAKPPRVDVSLRIVRVLRAAGRHSEAIAYAARARTPQRVGGGEPTAAQPPQAEPKKAQPPKAEPPKPERAPEEPPESVSDYQQRIAELIARKDAAAYREAAQCLKKLRALHKQAGTAAEFTGYVAELVHVHRRKTRLLAEIRAARIAMPKG